MAAELEQQRQEELLVVHRAEIICLQRARARLNAAERQYTLGTFLRQREGGQPVFHICGIVATLPRISLFSHTSISPARAVTPTKVHLDLQPPPIPPK